MFPTRFPTAATLLRHATLQTLPLTKMLSSSVACPRTGGADRDYANTHQVHVLPLPKNCTQRAILPSTARVQLTCSHTILTIVIVPQGWQRIFLKEATGQQTTSPSTNQYDIRVRRHHPQRI